MSICIDASVTLAWYFEDESSPATDEFLEPRREGWSCRAIPLAV